MRNPFINKTILDCDKEFIASNLIFRLTILTKSRRDTCQELFRDIQMKTKHDKFHSICLDKNEVLLLHRSVRNK
jgi:hypothetical protein